MKVIDEERRERLLRLAASELGGYLRQSYRLDEDVANHLLRIDVAIEAVCEVEHAPTEDA